MLPGVQVDPELRRSQAGDHYVSRIFYRARYTGCHEWIVPSKQDQLLTRRLGIDSDSIASELPSRHA